MNVYELQSGDLENLGQYKAVELFRRILWAESARVGIGRNLLDVPDCINIGDGGLDAVIENATPLAEDIIPSGLSGFQIKSSDLPPADCKRELHQRESLQNPLKPETKQLLDNNGTYVLVIFADITVQMKRRREDAIKAELSRMGYTDPKIRIYTTNQIMSFVERFPSLVSWLKVYPTECLPYSTWAENRDVSNPKTFVADEQRKKIAEEIAERIRQLDGKTPVFRISGLSGLGKTRLAFETLSPSDLQNRTIYIRASAFQNSVILNKLLIDENLEATVVVDECSLEDHEHFVRYFSNKGSRLALITISHETGKVSTPTFHYRLGPLSRDDIKKLLSEEVAGLPSEVLERLVDFADGYPRIAVLLAENYLAGLSSREDILTLNDESLITRLIAGRLKPSSEQFRKTKLVLMGLSLFEKVGFRGQVSKEAEWVAGLVGVDWNEFQEIVRAQKQRGIIQGDHYIYVTPFLLAVYLLREWWETYGDRTDLQDLISTMPESSRQDMTTRISSRFPYITSTEPGRKLVGRLLSKEGIFAESTILDTSVGSQLFAKLTESDPRLALHCLMRTIGTWNKEQLLEFRIGRRQIIHALEKIAVWRELFPDAARLLLALGEAENESYANNASGVFADLFSQAWGPVSPTEASPEERFPILVEAINSDSIERRKLALKGFQKALQWGHFHRLVGAEYQGARAPPRLWTPEKPTEILDNYRRAWHYLEENLTEFDSEIRKGAVSILLQSSRSVASVHPSLAEMVLATIRRLPSESWVQKDELLRAVSRITHYDGKKMAPSILEKWTKLRDELVGSSFSDLLARFVRVELLQDYYHDGEEYSTKWVESKIRGLAEEAIGNPNLLETEYPWLTTAEAKRGHIFGYELGRSDVKFSLLEKLIQKQRQAGSEGSVNFLGGYFRALFERNRSLWEDKLEVLSRDQSLKRLVPELTWRSGMTDTAARRILLMAKEGEIGVETFRIFRFGGVVKDVSEQVFIDYAEFLLKETLGIGALIALELSYSYYAEGDMDLDKDLALSLLLHPVFWGETREWPWDQMVVYYWKEVAGILIRQFPETEDRLAKQIISSMGRERTVASSFHSEILDFMFEIVEKNPDRFWDTITEYLGPPIDRRAFHLKNWLRGEKGLSDRRGALELFNPSIIWKWVDEDVDNRGWYLATFVPPYLFRSTEKICLAREMLARYGDQEEVRRNFSANYSTEGWSGSASVHFETKMEELLRFKETETDPNVTRWIEEYMESLEKDIERARIMEEREGWGT